MNYINSCNLCYGVDDGLMEFKRTFYYLFIFLLSIITEIFSFYSQHKSVTYTIV